MSSVEVSKALLVGRFTAVIEFFGKPVFDFFDHFGWIEAAEPLLQDGAENVGVLEVSGDGCVNSGVLHFHCDRTFFAGRFVDDDGAVYLPD